MEKLGCSLVVFVQCSEVSGIQLFCVCQNAKYAGNWLILEGKTGVSFSFFTKLFFNFSLFSQTFHNWKEKFMLSKTFFLVLIMPWALRHLQKLPSALILKQGERMRCGIELWISHDTIAL